MKQLVMALSQRRDRVLVRNPGYIKRLFDLMTTEFFDIPDEELRFQKAVQRINEENGKPHLPGM